MSEVGPNRKMMGILLIAASLTASSLFFSQTYEEQGPDGISIATGDAGNGMLSSFGSHEELQTYLSSAESGYQYVFGGGSPTSTWNGFSGSSNDGSLPLQFSKGKMDGDSDQYYSSTNVQVAGVDEADIVKTDGKYIYLTDDLQVDIYRAYPPTDMSLASSIDVKAAAESEVDLLKYIHLTGIYYVEDDNLMVLCTASRGAFNWAMTYNASYNNSWMFNGQLSLVMIYDISDRTKPELKRTFGTSGYLQTSRLIGDTIYLVTSSSIRKQNDSYSIPAIWANGAHWLMEPERITYDDESDGLGHRYLNVLAARANGRSIGYVSTLADYSTTCYMSRDNLFVTFATHGSLMGIGETTICRISADGTDLKVNARGAVQGRINDQFSMDEHDGNLRVATTDWVDGTNSNGVYVLDASLKVIGSLEDIAPGETIYSTRFMGDTLYMVTFRRIDPFFVIDLSDPSNPAKLGELELPGFSTYLHPIDDNHMLGIGRDGSYLKLTLFDVTAPTDPIEDSTYLFDACSYSSSEAEYEHKAVLYDGDKGLLAIPIYTHTHHYEYSGGYASNSHSEVTGIAVLDISTMIGISLVGIIEGNGSYLERTVRIGDYLYSISASQIIACRISDLSVVATIDTWIDDSHNS